MCQNFVNFMWKNVAKTRIPVKLQMRAKKRNLKNLVGTVKIPTRLRFVDAIR